MYMSEVRGGASTVSPPRTGKSISISISIRSCVRAKLRGRVRRASSTLGLGSSKTPRLRAVL